MKKLISIIAILTMIAASCSIAAAQTPPASTPLTNDLDCAQFDYAQGMRILCEELSSVSFDPIIAHINTLNNTTDVNRVKQQVEAMQLYLANIDIRITALETEPTTETESTETELTTVAGSGNVCETWDRVEDRLRSNYNFQYSYYEYEIWEYQVNETICSNGDISRIFTSEEKEIDCRDNYFRDGWQGHFADHATIRTSLQAKGFTLACGHTLHLDVRLWSRHHMHLCRADNICEEYDEYLHGFIPTEMGNHRP